MKSRHKLATVGVQQPNALGLPPGAALLFTQAQAKLTATLHILTTKGKRGRKEAYRSLAGAIGACETLSAWLREQ